MHITNTLFFVGSSRMLWAVPDLSHIKWYGGYVVWNRKWGVRRFCQFPCSGPGYIQTLPVQIKFAGVCATSKQLYNQPDTCHLWCNERRVFFNPWRPSPAGGKPLQLRKLQTGFCRVQMGSGKVQRVSTHFNKQGWRHPLLHHQLKKIYIIYWNTYRVQKVSIYEWKNEKFDNKLTDIKTAKPYRCNDFTIHNTTYNACGRGISANAVKVLKWSGKQFEPFQDLPSSFVYGRPHSFRANGTLYLAVPIEKKPGFHTDTFNTDSFIYRWDGIKFVHHQSISTHGTNSWDSFTTAAGEVFLVVDNRWTQLSAKFKSAVYKMVDNKFKLYQQLSTTGAVDVHAFTHKGMQYLAVVNHRYGDDGKIIRESPVYTWNWDYGPCRLYLQAGRTLMKLTASLLLEFIWTV